MNKILLFLNVLLFGAVSPAAAQSLDATFTPPNLYQPGRVYSAVEQPDGKRVVAGIFLRVNSTAATSLVRFEASGGLDAAFQQNVGSAAAAYRPRLLSTGQIQVISLGGPLVAGGITRQSVLRLNANGTGDASFNPGTGATQRGNPIYVDDALLLPNGQTVVVGPFDQFNGQAAPGIVRLTATGAVDPTFNPGTGVSNEIEVIIGLPNGQMLIGGYFTSFNGNPCNGLARLNADGSYDRTFVTPFETNSEAINLVLQPDGKILVAGAVYYSGLTFGQGRGLVRLLPSGALDPAYAGVANLSQYSLYSYFGDALQVQPNGKILISANISNGANGVSRLNEDGTADNSFQLASNTSGTQFSLYSLTLLGNGKILVGGEITRFLGVANRPLLLLNSDGTLDPAFQPLIQTPGTVRTVVRQADSKLVVAGFFTEIGTQPVQGLARFNTNGTLDAVLALPSSPQPLGVFDVALQPDGHLLALTGFGVVRLLSSGALDNSYSATLSGVYHRMLLQPDGKLLVGSVNASPSLVRLNSDGSVDGSFSVNTSGAGRMRTVLAIALQADGKILVTGNTVPAGGSSSSTVSSVMRLESTGAVDANFTSLPFGGASATSTGSLAGLVVQPDGKILVGGRFTSYGGTARANLLRLNTDGTLDTGFAPPTFTGTVYKLLLQANNRILVGGSFSGAGLPNNLLRVLPTGQVDATFGNTAVPNGLVYDLLVQPDGAIVLGGMFSAVAAQATSTVARITAANVLHVKAPQAVTDRTEAWPVPANTVLNVAPDPMAHPQSLDLLDALGRTVLQQKLSNGAPTQMTIETLAPGSYLLRVVYAEGTVMRRIQVQ